ncbi:MAG: hypothetical protein IT305_01770 [Chloroflexi bacterium]|nr:hypothetical protein [Chloroflexota bacterium]
MPRLRWFQMPGAWLPIIEQGLRRVRPAGWQVTHDVDVPGLTAVGRFRRGEHIVRRAAEADRVVLTLRRRL